VERELVMTGIGGQGIQLASAVVAQAAAAEGRYVQVFGSYGGMMRGGNTEATIVVADAPIEAPPTVGTTWSAVLMHPAYAERPLQCVRSDGVVLVNTTVFDSPPAAQDLLVVEVAATDVAGGLGNPVAASMVMIGAYAAVTRIVTLDSLVQAARDALPPYRAKHAELNDHALLAGFDAVPGVAAEAWASSAPSDVS
jgi:2-oxoacid:acceptor oxidoreductase gamma subunit (pyruvate/2-ketoisovalerate family)